MTGIQGTARGPCAWQAHSLARRHAMMCHRLVILGVEGSLPEAKEEGTGLLAHLVVWNDISKSVAYVPEVLQHWVPLLPLAHQDGIGIHLRA